LSREYRLITGSIEDVQSEVNELLGRGWAPLGPPAVVGRGANLITVVQALVDQEHAPVDATELYHALQQVAARTA